MRLPRCRASLPLTRLLSAWNRSYPTPLLAVGGEGGARFVHIQIAHVVRLQVVQEVFQRLYQPRHVRLLLCGLRGGVERGDGLVGRAPKLSRFFPENNFCSARLVVEKVRHRLPLHSRRGNMESFANFVCQSPCSHSVITVHLPDELREFVNNALWRQLVISHLISPQQQSSYYTQAAQRMRLCLGRARVGSTTSATRCSAGRCGALCSTGLCCR